MFLWGYIFEINLTEIADGSHVRNGERGGEREEMRVMPRILT